MTVGFTATTGLEGLWPLSDSAEENKFVMDTSCTFIVCNCTVKYSPNLRALCVLALKGPDPLPDSVLRSDQSLPETSGADQ